MNRERRVLLLRVSSIWLVYCLFGTPVLPQSDSPETTPSVRYDSSAVQVRTPPSGSLTAFLNNDDFRYDRTPPPANSIMSRIRAWFRQLFRGFPSEGWEIFWRDFLPYLILGVAIIIVVTRLMKTDVRGMFSKTDDSVKVAFQEVPEDIKTTDFKNLIAQAMQDKQFKRAIRLYYLSLLQTLSEKELIDWRIDKTNRDYVRELRDPGLQQAFATVTRLFECIWYGDMKLSDPQFQTTLTSFERLEKQISRP